MHWAGLHGLLWGVNIVISLMSAWLYPCLLLQRLRHWKTGGTTPLSVPVPSV